LAKEGILYVGFEVLGAMIMKSTVFCGERGGVVG
jgi:hypothetical protein